MRRPVVLLAAFLLVLAACLPGPGASLLVPAAAAQQSFPRPTGYVDDFAHVLTPAGQAELEVQAAELHDKTRAQVFVVTIDSLQGNDIKPFANDLFHSWKIGEKGTDRGALILFVIADHKWRIEVGSGLEGILNDAKVGDLGRAVVPELKAASYDAAAEQAFAGVAGVIAKEAQVTLTPAPMDSQDPQAETDAAGAQNDKYSQTDAGSSSSSSSPDNRVGCTALFFFGFLGFIGFLCVAAALKGKGRSSSGPYVGGGSSGSSDWESGSSSSSSSGSSDSSSFGGGDGGDSSGGGADGSW